MDFTLRRYRQLCMALVENEYSSYSVCDFIQLQHSLTPDARVVILRHDVDRLVSHALKMARIERDCGLRASYYFRIPKTYDIEVIAAIAQMGHEVGLHYEVVDKAKGDHGVAANFLKEDLEKLRHVANVSTATMHGNPFTPWDNRDIWSSLDYESFSLVGEGYLSVDFSKTLYFTDTGRSWGPNRFNIKDVIPAHKDVGQPVPSPQSTKELIAYIRSGKKNLYLSSHPNRWKSGVLGWSVSYVLDTAINYSKLMYKHGRRFLSPATN